MFDLNNVSYDKKPERIVRDILNKNLKNVMVTCNPDIYKFDLKAWQKGKENHLGYIEVERAVSSKWIEDYYEISFLYRKIIQALKDSALENTIYLKFKEDYSCCFCASMINIVNCNESKLSGRTGKNENIDLKNDIYISVPKNRPDIVIHTPDKVFKYIDSFFTEIMINEK